MNMLTRIIVTSVTLVLSHRPQYRIWPGPRGARCDRVCLGDRVIGRDPDPFIRGQLHALRQLGI